VGLAAPVALLAQNTATPPARSGLPASAAKQKQDTSGAKSVRAAKLEELSELDLQIQVEQKRGELARSITQSVPSYQLPYVNSIFGGDGGMRAVLSTTSGARMTVAAGDRLMGAVTVSSITSGGVQVQVGSGKGARIVALEPAAVSGTATAVAAPGQAAPGVVGLPPLPPPR
jgi:type IV pilus biogenesis protein PilP